MLVLTASNNFSRFSKQTQFASITAQDLPLRTALIVRSGNLPTKCYNTQLSGEIRKAKLIKYENDIPCVTYRSCELQRDNEPFENFAVAFPIAVACTSSSVIFSQSRVRSVIEVMFFQFPFFVAP